MSYITLPVASKSRIVLNTHLQCNSRLHFERFGWYVKLNFPWRQGPYGALLSRSPPPPNRVCVWACLRMAVCVDLCLQADSIYKHCSHVGRLNEREGFAIKLPGIIYSALCDVPANQIWWHWFDRKEGERLGWVRGKRAFFGPFLSFLFYPLRHFVIVYSLLRS